jgi:hypothetical protein
LKELKRSFTFGEETVSGKIIDSLTLEIELDMTTTDERAVAEEF